MDYVIRQRLGQFEPNADVFVDEERGQVVVAVEIAGADPESLRIAIDGRHLWIFGRRPEAVRLRHGSFMQKEIVHGEFAKRVYLPMVVDFVDVAARYTDGVLVIALPVAATAYLPTTLTEIRLTLTRTIA